VSLHNSNTFIERSLKSAADFLKYAIFSEEIARSKGLLQAIDPRIKIALLVVFLLTACLATNMYFIIGLYLISVVLAVLSRVNLLFFIQRVWVFIPIFAVIIAIPAMFMQGAYSAMIFIFRVATCVSFAVLMMITTKHNQFFKSLRSFGVPSIFIQILDMTYRYIFLFIRLFEEMHLSLKARSLKQIDIKRARHWIASRISFLFKRSVRMSEEVYLAMLARGYSGEIKKYGK